MSMNVQQAICNHLWKDALESWSKALYAGNGRDRPSAALHLVMVHNCLSGIIERLIPEPEREPKVCGITLTGFKIRRDTVRRLLLGCIGEEGLSDIEDLTAAFKTAYVKYFPGPEGSTP